MAIIDKIFKSKGGHMVAALKDGRYIARLSSMYLCFCTPNGEAYRMTGEPFASALMMREIDDFCWCVEHIN